MITWLTRIAPDWKRTIKEPDSPVAKPRRKGRWGYEISLHSWRQFKTWCRDCVGIVQGPVPYRLKSTTLFRIFFKMANRRTCLCRETLQCRKCLAWLIIVSTLCCTCSFVTQNDLHVANPIVFFSPPKHYDFRKREIYGKLAKTNPKLVAQTRLIKKPALTGRLSLDSSGVGESS